MYSKYVIHPTTRAWVWSETLSTRITSCVTSHHCLYLYLYIISCDGLCVSEKCCSSLSLSLCLFVSLRLFFSLYYIVAGCCCRIEIYNVGRHAHLLNTSESCPQRKFVCLFIFIFYAFACCTRWDVSPCFFVPLFAKYARTHYIMEEGRLYILCSSSSGCVDTRAVIVDDFR